MENSSFNPKKLHNLYNSLLFLQLLGVAIVLYFIDGNAQFSYDFEKVSNTVAPLSAAILLFLSQKAWKDGMAKIAQQEELEDKLEVLHQIHVYRWALATVATLVLLIYAYVELNYLYLALAIACIIYYLTLRMKNFSFTEAA